MKSLTGRLLKTCYDNEAAGVTATVVSLGLPIIPLAVLGTTLAIDAVVCPFAWLMAKSQPPHDPYAEALSRLTQAEQLSLQISDPEEREAYLAGISMQRRKLLLAQATGASLDSCGPSDQPRQEP